MEKFKIFDTLSQRFIFSESQNNKRKFHKEIDKDKEYILNYYRNTPIYKDKIDNMEMHSRGYFYFNSLIKNKFNKKNFFIDKIFKSISGVKNKTKNSSIIGLRKYNLPKLQLIKERKKRMDLKLKAKEDEENFEKNHSMEYNKYPFLSSYKNYLESNTTNNKRLLSNSQSVIFSGVIKDLEINTSQNQKNDLSHSFSTNLLLSNKNSEINSFNEKERMNQFKNILDKCQKEIKSGGKIGGKMEKFTNKFNRKEYSELVNDKRKIDEYNLYHEEVNKEYENLVQNRIKEKTKFKKVKNLLEDSYKKKNYLANKIKNYYRKRFIQKSKAYNEKNNLEIITNEDGERGTNLGTLLPKLLSKKKENSVKNKKSFFYFD